MPRGGERVLRQFYDFLSAEKLVGKDTLQAWRDQLLVENYAVRSVNSKVSTINALLESMGCREFQVTKQLPAEEFDTPVLLKMCTRVAHSQSLVELSDREERQTVP